MWEDWHFVSLTDGEHPNVSHTVHVQPGSLAHHAVTQQHGDTAPVYWVTNCPLRVVGLDFRPGYRAECGVTQFVLWKLDWNGKMERIFFSFFYLCIPPLAAIRVEPVVDAGHGEGSLHADGEPLEWRLPGSENVMCETGPLLSLLQHGQPALVSAIDPANITGLLGSGFSKEIIHKNKCRH